MKKIFSLYIKIKGFFWEENFMKTKKTFKVLIAWVEERWMRVMSSVDF